MIAVIIDIVASREVDASRRKKFDRLLREALGEVYERFKDSCVAAPALTQGDSVELLVNSWQPIVFLFHKLLVDGFEFRAGFGTGDIIIQKELADECDGPVFWNAREALDEIKRMKYLDRSAGFKFDEKTRDNETTAVIYSILIYTTLLGLSMTQVQYCYHYIWEKKQISKIAEVTGTSKGNVSKTLGKTSCYLLEKVMSFLDYY
jgi:hypothetical protein